ncbi:MAG: DedA family protein [Saccharospirillum sp.]
MIEAFGQNPQWVLLAIALTAFFESFALIGLLLPGVVMLFTLAALAGNQELLLPWVLLAAALGACAGDISSYFIGRWLHPRVAHWRWFERHSKVLEQGHWFFMRWGWLGVAVGRFVGPIRPIVPLVAGTLAMPAGIFIGVSVASVLVWAPAYILPGYLTGEVVALLDGRSLSDRALAATALTSGLILLAGLTVYHHMHPEHPRTARLLPMIRSFPPDFPFASLTLALAASLAIGWLHLASPLIWDQVLLDGASLWRDSAVTPWVARFHQLSSPPLLLMISLITGVWLMMRRYLAAGLHWLVLPGGWSLWLTGSQFGIGLTQPGNPLLSGYLPGELAAMVLCVGLLAAFFNEGRPAGKRWQLYLPAGALMMFMTLAELWLGLYSLSDSLKAVAVALLVCALVRTSYTSLSPKRLALQQSKGLLSLLGVLTGSFLVVSAALPVH